MYSVSYLVSFFGAIRENGDMITISVSQCSVLVFEGTRVGFILLIFAHFQDGPKRNLWSSWKCAKIRCTSKPEQVKMARLKIGHTRLTHEHRLKGVAEPMCQECNTILTVEHILLNCKKFENSRKNHLKNVTSMKNVFDNNECKTILNFLREVQLFEKI